MRSYLFVPGDSERKLEKSVISGADCLLIDLEDSVALSQKGVARQMAADFTARQMALGSERTHVIIRVNPLSSGLTDEDLAGVLKSRPDGILLPKSESGADVQRLSVMMAVHEAEAGIREGNTDIHALVTETALGTLNTGTYVNASPRLRSLSWGAEDLAADLGVEHKRDDTGEYTALFGHARTMTVFGAAAAGIDAVDTVFVDFRDQDGLEAECRAAVRDGFTGKMAIHPGQVAPINRIFTPSESALDHARKIVDLFENAGENTGVLSLDGKMVDQPHLKLARRILARAKSAGRI
ncbi:MAG: CoA ester lyase [Alphaproteobacteria bacterium]|nr:CoA ester lyase [Alphaproteobacteria bacterium]